MGSAGRQQKQREGAAVRSGGSAAPFLLKTHDMVEERETDEVISWGENGVSFVVWKPVEFARDLLPFHFKHNNFSSFVRQLNTYGFHKVVPNKWEFANDYFRRGEPALLSAIRRRKGLPYPAPPLQSPILSNRQPHLPSASHSTGARSSYSASSPPTPHLQHLSSENEKLRRDNRMLSNELENAKRHCDELLSFLSKQAGIRQLDVCNLIPGAGGKGGEEAEGGEAEDEGEKSRSCLKLFGVILNESCGDGRRTKNRRCDCSVGITKVGESWAGVSSPVG